MKSIEFKAKGISTITVGDPLYLEHIDNGTASKGEKSLVFSRKVAKSMEIAVSVKEDTEHHGNLEFTTIQVDVYGIRHTLSELTKTTLMDTFKQGKFHPKLVKEEKDLACDTAEFVIKTDRGYEEFHTGADGYYGNVLWYKDNNAFWLSLSLDVDMFEFEDVVESMKNLFGFQKELVHLGEVEKDELELD